MNKDQILVYGATGFTAQLLTKEILKFSRSIILAGRNKESIEQIGKEFGLPHCVFDLQDQNLIQKNLESVTLVINCAGPFKFTFRPIVEACLQTGTHYIDITGEIEVFEAIQQYDTKAKAKGIMLMPGCGFDVVPSDCLALKLKNKLPDATHLQLAFCSVKGSWSGGTMKTMIEGMGKGGMVRENGNIKIVPNAFKTALINYGPFEAISVTIPWGDVSTAFFSTRIPNIEVYLGANEKMIGQMKKLNMFGFLLKWKWVKKIMLNRVDKNKSKMEAKAINPNGRNYLYGKAMNAGGELAEARLETMNGYTLTALTGAHIAEKISLGNFKPGYQTPSSAYGENLITEISGCKYDQNQH